MRDPPQRTGDHLCAFYRGIAERDERVGLSTDCGLVNLPRMVAAGKFRAPADGAAIVGKELQAQ